MHFRRDYSKSLRIESQYRVCGYGYSHLIDDCVVKAILSLFLVVSLSARFMPFALAQPALSGFEITATDIAFDPVRPYVYVSSEQDSSLYVIDLDEGALAATFPFDLRPGALSLRPDGAMLYLALWTHDHPSNAFDPGDHGGVIAIVNLEQLTLEDTLTIVGQDPHDLAATDDGHLYVAGVLDRTSSVAGYQLETGARIGSDATFFPNTKIKVHPSQRRIYGVKDNQPSTIERWRIESGEVTREWHSREVHSDSGRVAYGNLFISPLGDRLVSPIGKIFVSAETEEADLRYLGPLPDISQGLPDPMTDLLFDVEHSAIFALFDDRVDYFNLATYQQVGTFPIAATGLAMNTYGEALVVARTGADSTLFFDVYPNPMRGASDNDPPVAAFTIEPNGGTTRDFFTFDASGTTDAETASETIKVRWDWDSDGIFDTPYGTVKTTTTQYHMAGVKQVTLEVSDALALTDTLVLPVEVLFESDQGRLPSEANLPFTSPYAFDHVTLDVHRSYAYLSAREAQKIAFMNLRSGQIEKEFDMPVAPELTFMTPDSAYLYAGLRIPEDNPYFSSTRRGFIVLFDLETQETINQFWIDLNPAQMAAYGPEYIYVNGVYDAGILTEVLSSYHVADGATVGEICCMGFENILPTPEQDRLYGSRWNQVFVVTTRADGNIFLRSGQGVYISGAIDERFYLNPAGTRAITDKLQIFSTAVDPQEDFQFVQHLQGVPYANAPFGTAINDVFFDPANEVALVSSQDSLATFDAVTFDLLGKNPLPGIGSVVGSTADSLFVAIPSEQRIYPFPHPAPDGIANTPPIAVFSVSPDSGLVDEDVFTFDPTASSDLETSAGELVGRWDWDGDRRYDTPFEPLAVVQRTFNRDKLIPVTLQVRDALLLTDTATQTIRVIPVSREASPDIPERIALHPNFPNPFQDHTTFPFSLPHASHVRLLVFDLTGVRVATLVDQVLPAGYHTINWEASGHASGMYFVRLQTGDAAATSMKVLRIK